MSHPFEVREYGERAFLLEVEDSAHARRLAAAAPSRWSDLREVVPGHRTVLLAWEEGRPARCVLEGAIPELLDDSAPDPVGRSVSVPVVYDGEDLEAISRHSGLGPEEVIRVHGEPEYEVAFVGFVPGFAYLIGGDARLEVPRRSDPRTVVPKGSVAIAGRYSAIYPMASPGGWNLLGRTSIEPFDPDRPDPALLRPGDRVRFEAI